MPAWSASRPPARLGRFPGKAGKRPTPNLHARKERPDPVKGSGRSFGKRKGALLPSPSWTPWNGMSAIQATTGQEIGVVEADAANKAVKAGKTTVTAKEGA